MDIKGTSYKTKLLSPLTTKRRSWAVKSASYMPSLRKRAWACGRLLCRWGWSIAAICSTLVGTAVVTLLCVYEQKAAQVDVSTFLAMPQRNELYDSQGRFLRALPPKKDQILDPREGPSTRRCVSFEEMPPSFIDALTSSEDREFFRHGGVNWKGVARAFCHDLASRSLDHGGSSITQQTVKMWLWGTPKEKDPFQKMDRKLLEWRLAAVIERSLTKQQILAAYANRVDYGAGLHGLYAACEGFFGKKPSELTVLESATLVAILRGPGEYSPLSHPANTIQRRNLILRIMESRKLIEKGQAAQLAMAPLTVKVRDWLRAQKPDYASALAAKELEQALPEKVLKQGGLRVELTLDVSADEKAATSLMAHLGSIEAVWHRGKQPLQGAVMVVDNRTGEIRILRGGRDVHESELNRLFQSVRQPGSTIKPFIYYLAFEQGMKPTDWIDNEPLKWGELGFGDPSYSPKNAGSRGGRVQLQDALETSQNLASVRVGARVGVRNFAALLGKLKIVKDPSAVPLVPPVFLGSLEVRPVDLIAGYTVFANGGPRCADPHVVARAVNAKGNVVYAATTISSVSLDATHALTTADVLRGVFERGTAKSARSLGFVEPALGKTGTTNGVKDAWFIGSTDRYTCGVWVGYDRPRKIGSAIAARLAVPLWVKVMPQQTPGQQTAALGQRR